jgi:hypothetical protein
MKILDASTPFAASVIYVLYRSFEKIAIVKPLTTLTSMSERYLIGEGFKKENVDVLTQHFQAALHSMEDSLSSLNIDDNPTSQDYIPHQVLVEKNLQTVLSLVPLSMMEEGSEIHDFLYDSNLV